MGKLFEQFSSTGSLARIFHQYGAQASLSTALRWQQWRMYPVGFVGSRGIPSTAGYVGAIRETAGYPQIYNIEADPKEEVSVARTNGWLVAQYLQLVSQYRTLDTNSFQ